VAKVRLSPAARADLAGIDGFSAAEFGDDVADAYWRGFREAFLKLAEYPPIGSARPDYGDAVRCLSHRSHRILYAHRDDTVHVLRILHHAPNVRNALFP
jgi:toxin ParE1/3/4